MTATDSNLFQSPFRAGIRIDAYQMEPLRKALRVPQVNLFIADDTGLGETIEAGLIARELLLRRKAMTIAVAAPSVLEQWKGELEDRFGLVFEILDRAYLTRMRRERGFGVNPWTTHSRFLVSHSLLIDPSYADPMRAWLGPLRPGSLLILDEAHHAAPSSGAALRHRVEVHPRRPRPRGALRAPAVPVGDAAQRPFEQLLDPVGAARPYRFTRGVKVGAGRRTGPPRASTSSTATRTSSRGASGRSTRCRRSASSRSASYTLARDGTEHLILGSAVRPGY